MATPWGNWKISRAHHLTEEEKMNNIALTFAAFSISVISGFTMAQDVPAEMVIEQDDNAIVIFEKTLVTGSDSMFEITDIVSPTPDIIEYVDGSLVCHTSTYCEILARLPKYGPKQLHRYDLSNIPYSIARIDVMSDSIDIDLSPTLWGFNNFHIAEVITAPSPTLYPRGQYTFARAEGVRIGETDDYLEVKLQFQLQAMTSAQPVEYQTLQVVASGIDQGLVVWDTRLLGDGYAAVEGNKGIASGYPTAELYAFGTSHWNVSSGHYTGIKFFTNGTDQTQPGLDLSEYTKLTLTMNCMNGMVVEAFFGASWDSSQNFLADIQCDSFMHTYEFDISGANAYDIQTALWLNIPVWKNTGITNHSLWMNIDEIVLSK